MKNLFLILLTSIVFVACSEDRRLVVKTDTIAPGGVSDVIVENIPGGAILKYNLPEDEDLLYVKALYSLNEGKENEVRASSYIDSLVLRGFGTEDERSVKIIAVDHSGNESVPVQVDIKPLEPPVVSIGKSLNLMADFGGVTAFWVNETKAEVSVVLEVKDEYEDFIPLDVYYSSVVDGSGSTRGMNPEAKDFRIFVRDKWGNKSNSLEKKLTPLFEEKFNMLKFSSLKLDGDESEGWGWVMSRLWDGSTTGENGFHTNVGTGRWPQTFSMDMGQTGKISRIKLWQRWEDDYPYRHGNIKRFEVYGTNDEANLNDWNVWTKLFEGESIKPSGLPEGSYSAEDLAYVKAGEEFLCPPDMPAVRFLRFKVTETWSGGEFFHLMEMEVYGQVEK